MVRIEPACWSDDDHALWARIAAHDFEAFDAALTFAGRLARDHGWSLPQARAAIDEYRRFCFLALRADRELTPSEEVDEVWHQHLTYSRDYWQAWCGDVLRRGLHHGPTRGGMAEGRRFAEQYAETLAAYEAWFGPPPPAFWPGTAERFGRRRFRIVDSATHVVLPVPGLVLPRLRRLARLFGLGALLACLSAGRAEAATANPLDWTAAPFLALYMALACAALATALVLPSLSRRGGSRQPGQGLRLTPAELGFLAGGATRAADVLILEDLAAGRIVLDTRSSQVGPLAIRSDHLLVGEQACEPAWLRAERAGDIADLQARLAESGLILCEARQRALCWGTTAIVGPVILLGLAKLAVGLERDKPVGILTLLLVVTAVAALVIAHRSRVTPAGRAVVAQHKAEHDRALRAPRAGEVIVAFAVIGTAALTGTAFEGYARLIEPGDSGGSGGCGGGDGGGGCGGCGT